MVEFGVMLALITRRLDATTFDALPCNRDFARQVARYLNQLLRRGIATPAAVADRYLQARMEHLESCFPDADQCRLIRELLIALMFSDDSQLAARRVSEFFQCVSTTGELRDIYMPLAASMLESKIDLLLQVVPRLTGLDFCHWSQSIQLLSPSHRAKIARCLLHDQDYFSHINWRKSGMEITFLKRALSDTVRYDISVRAALERVILEDRSPQLREFAIHLLSSVADDAAAALMVRLAQSDPSARPETSDFLFHARCKSEEDDTYSSLGEADQALPKTRSLLLQLTYGDSMELACWARDQLHQLHAHLEYDVSRNAPRHPDLKSGLEWPRLDGFHA